MFRPLRVLESKLVILIDPNLAFTKIKLKLVPGLKLEVVLVTYMHRMVLYKVFGTL